MKAVEKESKLKALREEAKDLQARLGFASLQKESAEKEIQKIRTILEYQESMFSTLSQAQVDAEDETK